MVYPEYIKSRTEDEMSLGSSGDEESEEDVGKDDPDYCPSYWDDDDVPKVPKVLKAPKIKKKERRKLPQCCKEVWFLYAFICIRITVNRILPLK